MQESAAKVHVTPAALFGSRQTELLMGELGQDENVGSIPVHPTFSMTMGSGPTSNPYRGVPTKVRGHRKYIHVYEGR